MIQEREYIIKDIPMKDTLGEASVTFTQNEVPDFKKLLSKNELKYS